MIDRRTLIAGGGVALIGGGGALGLALRSQPAAAPAAPAVHARPVDDPTIARGLRTAIRGAMTHYFDGDAGDPHIRPTSAGGRDFGRVSHGGKSSFWEMACLANVLYNETAYDTAGLADFAKRGLAGNWAHLQRRAGLTPMMLAGNDTDNSTIYVMDDGCFQALFEMQAHRALGDAAALGFAAETVVNVCANFLDPDAASNPRLVLAPASPNLPGVDYGLGRLAGSARFRGRPFVTGRYGSTYTVPAHPNYAQIGKIGASVETLNAIVALYVHEHLGFGPMLDYARHIFALIHDRYLTPDPNGPVRERPNVPADPSQRKAQYLVEADLRLDRDHPNPQDPDAPFLQPLKGFYGRPLLAADSSYLLAATAYCLLGARLFRATGDGDYRDRAVRTANALISPQAYGRTVGGRLLIANLRDPHSDGMLMAPFAAEVLPLPGVSSGLRRAFVDTARHIATTCVYPDGYTSGDWTGPEKTVTGVTTWQQLYDANPGGQAGRQQIMVTSNSIAMLQAGAIAARTGGTG